MAQYQPQRVRRAISESAAAEMVKALKTVVGPGGTAEKAMLIAKESLMEPLDMYELLARGPRDKYEELRIELYEKVIGEKFFLCGFLCELCAYVVNLFFFTADYAEIISKIINAKSTRKQK